MGVVVCLKVIKRVLLLMPLIFLLSCCGNVEQVHSRKTNTIILYGEAVNAQELHPNPFCHGVDESSICAVDGRLISTYDIGYSGSLTYAVSNETDSFYSLKEIARCNINVRFPYTIRYGNKYYTFGMRYVNNQLDESAIYLWCSGDGIYYTMGNNDHPVLTKSSDPDSIWYLIWNVAVAVDRDGVFYLVAECAPRGSNQEGVGLGYSFCSVADGVIDFNKNRSNEHIVVGGGNPYLYYSKKYNTLLVLHGMSKTDFKELSSNYWWVAATYYDLKKKQWITKPERFALGQPGVHVCDPHAADVSWYGSHFVRLIVSYGQNSLYSYFLNGTQDDLLGEISR
jgi:hypothetical protein